jgi:hypothetical protein
MTGQVPQAAFVKTERPFHFGDNLLVALENQADIVPLRDILHFIGQAAHSHPIFGLDLATVPMNQLNRFLDPSVNSGFFELGIKD